jgi:hypothetical protein
LVPQVLATIQAAAWPGRRPGAGTRDEPADEVIVSDVPPSAASVGGGVLATKQQTAHALGVATLGSLFLALAGDGAGIRNGCSSWSPSR